MMARLMVSCHNGGGGSNMHMVVGLTAIIAQYVLISGCVRNNINYYVYLAAMKEVDL